jgi:peptidylprolyl isomerase
MGLGFASNTRTHFKKGMTMSQANQGDTIRVHYKGTLDDGTVFDHSEGREPLQLTLGERQVIPGFEAALMGMNVGESKTTTIPSSEAYGERSDQLMIKAPRDKMPEGHEPEVGQQLQMTTPEGHPIPVRISEVTETEVTLDANHPLAGENLTFELTLVEIV